MTQASGDLSLHRWCRLFLPFPDSQPRIRHCRQGQNIAVAIPQSFIQELLSRVDVVDIVGRYVQLKKGGANFMGLCPFHGEKSPSFTVSPSKQFFHCFGCGKNGNAIGFLMEHAGMGFVEAVQELANQCGLQVPQDDISPAERQRQAQQKQKAETLSDLLEKAGESYRKQLKGAPKAIEYLKKRGVSGEISKRFGLGYAPPGWHGLASVFAEYDSPQLEECGLVIVGEEDSRRYDRFRDRLMFPIRNVKGECIGFGGRVFGDEKPKYLNSPETPVFHKGRELYGLYEARQSLRDMGYALVTEGYMDVVALAQLGFANAVATLGTACTPEHVQKLFRFTESVVFSFDGDGAGRRAARKALDAALPFATDTRSIKFLFLPSEHDPDSFIREFGPEAFSRYVGDATPLSRFLIESASEGCDLGQAEGRAHMASNARPLWSLLPDGALKRQLLSEIATLAQLEPRDLSDIWAQEAARTAPMARRAPASAGSQPPDWDAPPSWDSPPEWSESSTPAYQPSSTGGGWSGRREPGRSRKPWGKKGDDWSPPQLGPRPKPVSREDQAARLLMCHMEFMEEMTHEDFDALARCNQSHAPLFRWLEAQFTESGPRSWAVLREQLQSTPCAALANKLMNGAHANPEGEVDELRKELRGTLNLILVDHLKREEANALKEIASDPTAARRYIEFQQRRKNLSIIISSAS